MKNMLELRNFHANTLNSFERSAQLNSSGSRIFEDYMDEHKQAIEIIDRWLDGHEKATSKLSKKIRELKDENNYLISKIKTLEIALKNKESKFVLDTKETVKYATIEDVERIVEKRFSEIGSLSEIEKIHAGKTFITRRTFVTSGNGEYGNAIISSSHGGVGGPGKASK